MVSTVTLGAAFGVLAIGAGSGFASSAASTLGWSVLSSALAIAAYVSVFAAIGAAVPFPLILSLGFGFVWEGVISGFQVALAKGTIVNSTRGVLYRALEARPDFAVSTWPMAGLLVATTVFLVLGAVAFREASYTK